MHMMLPFLLVHLSKISTPWRSLQMQVACSLISAKLRFPQLGVTLQTCLSSKTQAWSYISSFPCKYLGLPLHFKKPTKEIMQHVVQKIAVRLPRWKRTFFSYPTREQLVKYVLTSMPTFFLTIHKMQKWPFAKIDKFRRRFLWRGQHPDNVSGGHCLVNWQTCLRPNK
jgi:hypothetical protein